MPEAYKPEITPNPIAHLSGNEYTLAGRIWVNDNEGIHYVGRNEDNEFQFNIVSSTEPEGFRGFSETIDRVNNEHSVKAVTKKDGEPVGEAVFTFD